MARTTVDIDASVLDELKRLSRTEHKALGRVIPELVAVGLEQRTRARPQPALDWHSQAMQPLVDLEDKEAMATALNVDR